LINRLIKQFGQLVHKCALISALSSLSFFTMSADEKHDCHNHSSSVDMAIEFELPLLDSSLTHTKTKTKTKTENAVESTDDHSLTLRLSDYKGKVVYIDFWASWCTPCLVSMPLLNNLRNKYKSSGFEIIAINLDDEPDLALKFMQSMGIDYPVVSDVAGVVAKRYQVVGLPSAYILNENGEKILIHRGFKRSDINFLEAIISKSIDNIEH